MEGNARNRMQTRGGAQKTILKGTADACVLPKMLTLLTVSES